MPKDSIEEIKKAETMAIKKIQQAKKEADKEIINTEKQALQDRNKILNETKKHIE